MIVSGSLEQAQFENVTADPTTGLVAGRVVWNTLTNKLRTYTGSAWTDFVTSSSIDVLTNKDIDGGLADTAHRLTLPKAALGFLVSLPRKVGTLYFATDVGGGEVYVDNGTSLLRVLDGNLLPYLALTSGAQIITDKDIDGGIASNQRRITLPKGTLAALTALTRKEGTLLYATDTGTLYRDNGTTLVAVALSDTTVTLTGSQVITNKDFDGGVAANNRRITIPQGTLAAITALTRKTGTILYGTDTGLFYRDNGLGLSPLSMGAVSATAWDEVLGASGPQSLYSPGNFILNAAKTYHDLVVIGNLTLNANLIVTGNMYVSGQIISSGFKFDCYGDVYALGGANMSGEAMSITIGGNLTSLTQFKVENLSGVQPTFTVGGDVNIASLSGDILYSLDLSARHSLMASTGTLASRPGYNLHIRGDLTAIVSLVGGSRGNFGGGIGGNLVVGGNVRANDIFTDGGIGVNGDGIGGTGGAGGSVTISGYAKAIIRSDGGKSNNNFNAGNAGNVNIGLDFSGSIYARGGEAGGTTGNAGNGGQVTCVGAVSSYTGEIIVKGGDNLNGSGLAGNGGVVVFNSDTRISYLDVRGGFLETSSVTLPYAGSVNSYSNLDVYGDLNADGTQRNLNQTPHFSTEARNGASVIVRGNLTVHSDGTFYHRGSEGQLFGGNAGALEVRGNFRAWKYLANGGSALSSSGSPLGGVGVNAVIYGDCKITNLLNFSGGDASVSSGGIGGSGGTCIVYGSMQLTSIEDSENVAFRWFLCGGNSGTAIGASGTALTVYGRFEALNLRLDIRGGNSSGSVGRLAVLDCGGGGRIAWLLARPAGLTYTGTPCYLNFSGGLWNLQFLDINDARYGAGKTYFNAGMGATMIVDWYQDELPEHTGGIGLLDGEIPLAAIGNQRLLMGYYGAWKYLTFNNT